MRQFADAVDSQDLGTAAHVANELSWMNLRREQVVEGLHADGLGDIRVVDESHVGISVRERDAPDRLGFLQGKGISGVDAEVLAYRFTAQKLGIDQGFAFDSDQGRNVMTEELRNAIRKFQRSRGLHADGILGYSTLQEMSGKSSRSLRIGGGIGTGL